MGGAYTIIADDGERDHVECGDGTDEASLDRVDTTLIIGPDCENVRRASPCGGLTGGALAIC